MEEVNCLIIGAGAIGLAIAADLSIRGRAVLAAERHKAFGQETSSRNSEVIHGGMYYPAGSLKAELCIKGRRLLYELCIENRIPHKKIGKLIVATEKDELNALEGIFKQGKINGVEGISLISKDKMKDLEPNISGIAALYSQETGIVDSHCLMVYLLTTAKDNGALLVYNSEVIAIDKYGDGYKVTIKNAGEIVEVKALIVINCAGLDSDSVASMAGIDISKEKYNLYYCKGQYFRIIPKKSGLVNRLVYPVPQPKSGGLGIHVTPDLTGGLRLGPDDSYLNNRIKDYSVDENRRSDFFRSAVKFLPFLEETDLAPDLSGIRPKLQPKGGKFRDFIICDETEKGLPGFINLIGIESPGLTASLAIAKVVNNIVSDLLN